MKIAIFLEAYVSFVNGVKTHVKTLKTGLEELGHKVLIVCALPGAKKHYVKDGVLCCPSISWERLYNYGVAKPISPARFKHIKNFNPDIIHIHTEFGIGFSGIYAAKMLKIPFVYTMHTMYDDYLHYIAPKKFLNIAKKTAHFYARQFLKRATVVVGPSKKVAEFIKKCGFKEEVEIVPNAVELSLFNPTTVKEEEKLKLKESLNLKKEDFLGCFCGRLGKEKSVDVLLKSWFELLKEDKKFKLLILGDGPQKEELKALAKKLNILNNVLFLGKITHEDLPAYYFLCDFYITASLSEVHSISTLEAMASGLPVFHILDELNKNQIISGVNGFIYKDFKELKDLILKYYNSTVEQKKKLKETTRESVLKYGEKKLAEKIVKIYKKALDLYLEKRKKSSIFFKKKV